MLSVYLHARNDPVHFLVYKIPWLKFLLSFVLDNPILDQSHDISFYQRNCGTF